MSNSSPSRKSDPITLSTLHPCLAEIQRLFDSRGTQIYGDSVNQTLHALQCATLAEKEQADASLVVASWLHDIGHMQHRDAAAAVAQGSDDMHHALGAKFLSRWFGPEVSEPVRLHVQAKRYLCATEPSYLERLSPLSRQTLFIQGGPMTTQEALSFEKIRFHAEALRVRRWDDMGKQPNMVTKSHSHFLAVAASFLVPA